jgi:hypothetical protein
MFSQDPVALDDEISALTDQLSQIRQRRLLLFRHRCEIAASTTSIHSLPAEVLLEIFEIAHAQSRSQDMFAQVPQRISCVCQTWRDIVSRFATFWTHIVIPVDRDPPLAAIQTHIRQSKSHPLDIVISRSDCNFAELEVLEAPRLAAVMNLLGSCIGRWKSLHIAVTSATSLREAIGDIYGDANLLVNLNLAAQFEDGDGMYYLRGTRGPFKCPALQNLAIDGRTFRDMCTVGFWTTSMPNLESISLISYSQHIYEATLYEVLKDLVLWPALDVLCLSFFQIILEPGYLCRRSSFELNALNELVFEAIPFEVVVEFFRATATPSLEILQLSCYADHPSDDEIDWIDLPSVQTLRLHQFDSSFPLFLLLGAFSGTDLHISHTAKFEDNIIEDMDHEVVGEGWLCHNLVTMTLTDCQHFSSRMLRRCIEVRQQASFESFGRDVRYRVVALRQLEVHRCCDISPEDRSWFEENLECFIWDDEQDR